MKEKILVVCGPTASGKTALAVRAAQLLGGEVVSADCMLVYKGLDIGTAKPTAEERGGVPHHMIDVVPPTAAYSVGDYQAQADAVCADILRRGKVPVVCGGTGFYIQSLLFSRAHGGAGADAAVREKYERIAREEGNGALFARLAAVDPESAQRLHPNDVKRVVRALEIFELTGRRKSEQCDGFVPRRPYLAVALNYPREELYRRINLRVEKMLEAGLVREVEGLLAAGVSENSQSMQGIGYKEVLEYLKGNYSHSTMRDIIQQNTRRYAKRQITFFKKLPGIVWLEPSEPDLAARVTELYDAE